MLAVAGAIGAQARVPAMVLMRAPLGERGSYLPTAINVVQCLGWTVFELLVIATAAAALSDELLGFEARWAWTLVFGAAALAMGLLGPIGVVRTVIRRVAVWVVPLAVAYLGWWALTGGGLEDAWNRPGEGGLSTWQGIDIVVGVTVSWIPLAADYTRFARTPRGAFWGTGRRLLRPGRAAARARRRRAPHAGRRRRRRASGGGRGRRARRAARAPRADGRRDRRGVRERVLGRRLAAEPRPARPQRLLVVATTTLGTSARSCSSWRASSRSSSCSARASCRCSRCCSPTGSRAGGGTSPRTSSGARRSGSGSIAAWIAGFAAYQWLSPTGPAWWVDQVQRLDPPAWGIGATLPSFAVSFALALAVVGGDRGASAPRAGARVSRDRARRQPRRRPGRGRRRRGPAAGSSTPRAAALNVGADAVVVTRCAPADRDVALAPLEALGLPVTCADAPETTAFSFHYEGDHRVMTVDAVGDAWTAADVDGWAGGALAATRVGARRRPPPLAFPDARPLAALAARRPAAAPRRPGDRAASRRPARSSGTPGSTGDCCAHLAVLKLNEEEARDPRGRPRARSRCGRWACPRSSSRSARRARASSTATA